MDVFDVGLDDNLQTVDSAFSNGVLLNGVVLGVVSATNYAKDISVVEDIPSNHRVNFRRRNLVVVF